MNTRKMILWLLIALLAAAGLWLAISTANGIRLPWQAQEPCGIQSCHGLEISCGPDVPEMCTMEYQGGDNCRQFAACQVIDGQCTQVDSPRFEACKACVQQCEQDAAGDGTQFFACESQCLQ